LKSKKLEDKVVKNKGLLQNAGPSAPVATATFAQNDQSFTLRTLGQESGGALPNFHVCKKCSDSEEMIGKSERVSI
jgi:hypothetical protein